jgi:hypothetical protein
MRFNSISPKYEREVLVENYGAVSLMAKSDRRISLVPYPVKLTSILKALYLCSY